MFLKKVLSSFKNIDIFGHPVDLYFDKQNTVKSNFGAIITLSIFGICLYLLIWNASAWSNLHNLQIISSSLSLSASELAAENKSLEFQLDYQNYNLYFALFYEGSDGLMLNYKDLERYFVQKIGYWDQNSIFTELEYEFCNRSKMDIFLNLDQDVITKDLNKTSFTAICL